MRYIALTGAVLLGGCSPAMLGAQEQVLSCSQAVVTAQNVGDPSAQVQAVRRLGGCPEEVGEVLPALWKNAGGGAPVFEEVQQVSLRLNDRRIYSAAVEVAQDGGMPVERRLAALGVLARYLDPYTAITARVLANPPQEPNAASQTQAAMTAGLQPITSVDADRAFEVFATLSLTGSPTELQRAGRYLRQAFAWKRPEATPLAAGVVSGTWNCRDSLRLISTADVTLPLTLVDSDGKVLRTIELWSPQATIPAGYPTRQKPGEYVTTLARTGPLSVRLGSRTILTLNCQ